MPLSIPKREEVAGALETYVRSELPNLDPAPKRRSKIGAWVKSLGSALFDWYKKLKDYADNDPFPQTARGDFLFNGWWRPLTKLNPLGAAPSRGVVAFTGLAGTLIPAELELQANNQTFKTKTPGAIAFQSLVLQSLTYDAANGLCIAVCESEHQLATGVLVSITDAADTAYNGIKAVTVVDERDFTYQPSTVPGSPSTTGAKASATWGIAVVQSEASGVAQNLGNGSTLSVVSAPTGVDATAIATYGGISGGTDVESAEDYRLRILKALGTDFGMFSADEIEIVCKTVPGVTRVWIRQASLFGTNGVNEGQVKIAFVRDGDVNPIPTPQEIADVKATIINNIMPAHTAEEDVIVIAPTRKLVDINISALAPDTPTMRTAIKAQLAQFFREQTTFAQSIELIEIECAIKATVDLAMNAKLRTFTLSNPTTNITVGADELPMLGTVSFNA
jgi:uncharacterized phage protein gp47/JayE